LTALGVRRKSHISFVPYPLLCLTVLPDQYITEDNGFCQTVLYFHPYSRPTPELAVLARHAEGAGFISS
jgi:hypothetical protein